MENNVIKVKLWEHTVGYMFWDKVKELTSTDSRTVLALPIIVIYVLLGHIKTFVFLYCLVVAVVMLTATTEIYFFPLS